jgi:CRISPR-associated protein Cas5t
VSTVLGLINAVVGRYVDHEALELGYVFDFTTSAVDIETLWEVEGVKRKDKLRGDVVVATNKVKSNPIRREFLFEGNLTLYLFNEAWANCFRQPYFQLVLGRSGDLATVDEIRTVTLRTVEGKARLRGQVVPLQPYFLPGQVQALPQYFTNTFPRRNLGTQAYSVLSPKEAMVEASIPAMTDLEAQAEAAEQSRIIVGRKIEVPDVFIHTLNLASSHAATGENPG